MRCALFLKYWLPVVAWAFLIFAGSSDALSTHRTSRIIGPILRWLNPDISEETISKIQFVIRKGAHVSEYAILSILFQRALYRGQSGLNRSWKALAVLSFFLSASYAITDEFHQHFVSSRQGSIWDVLLDSCGAAIGLFLAWCHALLRNRRPNP